VLAGCAGHISGVEPRIRTNSSSTRGIRATGSGEGWSFNVTANGDGSTYTSGGTTYTVHVTDSLGSWQLVDQSGNVVLTNSTADGIDYFLWSSAASANINYNNLTQGATVPVASQSMTIASATQVNSSNGSSVNVINNGTTSAGFVTSVSAGSYTTTVGSPGGGARGGVPGGRVVLTSNACRWAIADVAIANVALILATISLGSGIGFLAFVVAYAASASAVLHAKQECA
jgi:hypothetical protein